MLFCKKVGNTLKKNFVQITNLYQNANCAFYISLFLSYETTNSPFFVFAILIVATVEYGERRKAFSGKKVRGSTNCF